MHDDAYRKQLADLVEAMSRPNRESAVTLLTDDSAPAAVKMFVDGNLDKRLDKLAAQLEFVRDAFEDFDDLLKQYIRNTPLEALDTSQTDGERMLRWLTASGSLTLVQQDYITVQRTRHAIERLALEHRQRHVAFQLLRREDEDADDLLLPETVVHLNPIRAWARLQTQALLDQENEGCELPCDTMFFADGGDIISVQLELEGQVLLNDLADNQPCSIGDWAELSRVSEVDTLIELAQDLVELGLIAVENAKAD
ncbi:MAG: hypothetical protein RIC55_01385 [Pirellulaceae bacterium]